MVFLELRNEKLSLCRPALERHGNCAGRQGGCAVPQRSPCLLAAVSCRWSDPSDPTDPSGFACPPRHNPQPRCL